MKRIIQVGYDGADSVFWWMMLVIMTFKSLNDYMYTFASQSRIRILRWRSTEMEPSVSTIRRKCGKSGRAIKSDTGSIGDRGATSTFVIMDCFT
jgi:hypothetical protein